MKTQAKALSKALTLADSGYFIGLFDPKDAHHGLCIAFSERFSQTPGGILVSSWSVFTEVSAMLEGRALAHFFAWSEKAQSSGYLHIENPEPSEIAQLWQWMQRYDDLPMDFCDASLVLLAIRLKINRIATTDQRDFSVYRLPGRQKFVDVLYDFAA
jgi:uncharacterized protein